MELGTAAPLLVPHIEVQQRGNELVVKADLPGLRPEDINVAVDRGVLTISGERRQEEREEREGFIRSEISYGTFYRTIPLPDGADEERVAATFRNGVLEITIPVSEREAGRKVQVQS
jgi:HSP20 family protein